MPTPTPTEPNITENILNATYTAEKEETTVPPCDNAVVTVTATYQIEFTLKDGARLSDIDTSNIEARSIAHDGSDTYVWDGTQWVLQSSGGSSSSPLITNGYSGSLDMTWQQIYDAMMNGQPVYIDSQDPNGPDYPNQPSLSLIVYIGSSGCALADGSSQQWAATDPNGYPALD